MTIEPRTILRIEVLQDQDGTYGARWSEQEAEGATWDHPDVEDVLDEVAHMFRTGGGIR